MKIGDRKTFIKLISAIGYVKIPNGKHEKYSNGRFVLNVPSPGKFSRPLYQRLYREAIANK